MGQNRNSIWVFAHWENLQAPTLVGELFVDFVRGKELFSFEYDQNWLQSSSALQLDPRLQLFSGEQFPADARTSFGAFLDSAPDRWGRVLLQRREALRARQEKRPVRTLRESDFLLGVFDGHRQGGLRFKKERSGPFLDEDSAHAAPPWASLRELQSASRHLEEEGAESDADYAKWLNLLVAPGASLGGARPKASVRDPQGGLWLAKFPSREDRWDIAGWEAVLYTLAQQCKISVPEFSLQRFGKGYRTLLLKRFDRTDTGKRIHFASAMTLLNRTDGDGASTGASYLEFVELLSREGARITADSEELWKRIVFFICTSNVDDHLRNHGFLLSPKGWCLSPAYDLNPVPSAAGLHLNISESDNSQNLELALEVAPLFRLKASRAKEIIHTVQKATRKWRAVAQSLQISSREQEEMAPAFRIADPRSPAGASP